MDEIRKVELLKTGKRFLDEGLITEEDYATLKDKVITEGKEPYAPLEELEYIKQKEKDGLITTEEYESIKNDLLAGKRIADSQRLSKLAVMKGYLSKGIINEYDYTDFKLDVLNMDSRRDLKKVEQQIPNLEGYKKLEIDGILTEAQYGGFKRTALSGINLNPDHGLEILYDYKQLMEDGVIDADDYDEIRSLVLQGKQPSWAKETSYLRDIYKYHQRGLISDDDYTENKAAFLTGEKYVSDEVLRKLSGYKNLVNDSVITDADYDVIKDNLLKSFSVKSVEEIRSLKDYNELKNQGAITQEEYDNYKEGLIPRPAEVVENERAKEKQKRKRQSILWGIIAALVLAVIVAACNLVPRMQAEKAYDNYLSGYDALVNAASYQDAEDKATNLLSNYDQELKDEEKETLHSRVAYASALEELDFTESMPSSRVDIESAKENLEKSDGYGISKELLQYLTEKEKAYDNYLSGTLTIDHSKYKEKADDSDSTANGVSFRIDGTNYYGYGDYDQTDGVATFEPTTVTGRMKRTTGNESSSDSAKAEKEEKPAVNKYDCEGFITLGFKKTSKGKGIEANNVQRIVVMNVEVEDYPKEDDICTAYNAVFEDGKDEDFEVTGYKATPVSTKGSLKDGVITADFGNGIMLKLNASKDKPSSYDSSSSRSGSSSYNKKDYSEGSEWEKYDSDSDGQINGNEFQDAVGDYMDKNGY